MWNKISVEGVDEIRKCVGEYQIWMNAVLPYGKMKIKVYECKDGTYKGYTDIQVKRKFDNSFEGAVGFGKSIDEALEDTMSWFSKMLQEDYPFKDYPNGLTEQDVQYIDYFDF